MCKDRTKKRKQTKNFKNYFFVLENYFFVLKNYFIDLENYFIDLFSFNQVSVNNLG